MSTSIKHKLETTEAKPIKKIKVFEDKENSSNIVSNQSSNPSVFDFSRSKKLVISHEERNMDGAPVGEIFDVAFIADEALQPLEDAEVNYIKSYQVLCEKDKVKDWAEIHSALENVRKIVLFNKDCMSNQLDYMSNIIMNASETVGSLRSSVSKNALYLLNSLIVHKDQLNIKDEDLVTMLKAIIHRTTSGANLLKESANSIIDSVVDKIPFHVMFNAFSSYFAHKNADTSSKSIQTLEKSFTINILNVIQNEELLKKCLELFYQGLGSKKSQSKASVRNIFQLTKDSLKEEKFDQLLSIIFSDIKTIEIKLEMSKSNIKENNEINGVKTNKPPIKSIRSFKTMMKQSSNDNSGSVKIISLNSQDLNSNNFDSVDL